MEKHHKEGGKRERLGAKSRWEPGAGSQTVSWEHTANKERDCPRGCSQSSSAGAGCWGGEGGLPQRGDSQPAGRAADVLQLHIPKTKRLLQTNSSVRKGDGGKTTKQLKRTQQQN